MSEPIIIMLTGGMNNLDTPLNLFLKQQGALPLMVNVDTTLRGRLKLLRPLMALNTTAESGSIHSVYRAQDLILAGAGTTLKYRNNASLTSLLTGLSGSYISMTDAANWIFLGDGTNKKSIYISGPTACDWGHAVPSVAPTVASGAAGNPNGTYSCYYRYKITLPDASIIYTGLSPIGSAIVANEKIEWSALVHASFTGATSVAIELFRTLTGWSATYLVTEIASGTTTYSDDKTDAQMQANTAFAESGYYPPPANINMTVYHPGCDRVFAVVDNKIYWSEAGLYHIFKYSTSAGAYSNVNSIFLEGEDVTGLIVIDEQLYIGSQKTWMRLRGNNPSTWVWEPTNAIKGPVSWRSLANTQYGVIYPGNNGRMWLFNGYSANMIVDQFIFDTEPDTTCHATYDGRFYRLCYGDTTYPEIIFDFQGGLAAARVIQSTRSHSASFYHINSNELYVGDSDGYLRNGDDDTQDVTLTFHTAEIPIEQLINIGMAGSLLVHANTQGDDLIITPYQDEVAQTALSAYVTSSLLRNPKSIPLNTYRTLSFLVAITSKEDIEIREPLILRSDEDDA